MRLNLRAISTMLVFFALVCSSCMTPSYLSSENEVAKIQHLQKHQKENPDLKPDEAPPLLEQVDPEETRQLASALGDSDLSFNPGCVYKQKLSVDLDYNILNESSGIAFSREFNKMYHINDSSGGSYIYTSDLRGQELYKVKVQGVNFLDSEDLTFGYCLGGSDCLIIADIGLSKGSRGGKPPTLTFIMEQQMHYKGQKSYPSEVTPDLILPLQFGEPVDAESIAIHPHTYDLFILTKNYKFKQPREAYVQRLYKIPFERYAIYHKENFPKGPVEAQLVAEIDLRVLQPTEKQKDDKDFEDWTYQVPTSMDIHPDGNKFIILNYITAIEVFHDPSRETLPPTQDWVLNQDYQIIPIQEQRIQEAVAYTPEGDGFVYTSELNPHIPKDDPYPEIPKTPKFIGYSCQ